MAQDKICIVVDKVKVVRIWDKTMTRAATDALGAALAGALGGSRTKVVDRVGKDEKGYRISPTIEALDFDDKKRVLSVSLKAIVSELPEDAYFAGLSNAAKIPDPNPRKMEADVKALLEAAGEGLGTKLRKAVE